MCRSFCTNPSFPFYIRGNCKTNLTPPEPGGAFGHGRISPATTSRLYVNNAVNLMYEIEHPV